MGTDVAPVVTAHGATVAAVFFTESLDREQRDFTSLDESRFGVFKEDSVQELSTYQECVCVCVVIQLFVGCSSPSLSGAACILEGGAVRLVPFWAQNTV